MASVLLVDTNRAAIPILRALEDLGHDVTVVGSDPSAPLARLASRYERVDYSDVDALADVIARGRYDHIVPGCTDRSYLACATVAGGRLPGLDDPTTAAELLDKDRAQVRFAKLGIPHPRRLDRGEALGRARVVIKPARGFSGRGVQVLHHPTETSLDAAIRLASALDAGPPHLEEFAEGQLHSCSAVLRGRRVVRSVMVREDCVANPHAVDVSRIAYQTPDRVRDDLAAIVEALADDLGLVDGVMHVQFMLDDARISVLEVTRRCPGDLYALLVRFATGVPYAHDYVGPFVGVGDLASVRPVPVVDELTIRHTVSAPDGVDLVGLRFHQPVRIRLMVPLAELGARLPPAPSGRAAILFLGASDFRSADAIYRDLLAARLYDFDGLQDGEPGG